jgi:hypothetical protein
MEKKRLISHAEAAQILRRAGFPQEQIDDALRELPDPIDTERYGDELLRHGISLGSLMDRMGGSP